MAKAAQRAATVERLLDAAAGLLGTGGAAAVSVQRVADAAGTSKALVHYHFAAKDALLDACAVQLAASVVAAESSLLDASTAQSVLDDLWRGAMAGRVVARRRALLALTTAGTAATAHTLARAMRERRAAAVAQLRRVEDLLGLSVPLPRESLAAAFVAMVDGLTLAADGTDAGAQRPAYDAFWLAVLSLDR